ncbi:hypothetical protein [Corynebacterium hindlerae]|uniref:hypothetical protein n=1 Tax=Corynebacterium hindlerae TaxID=699041 RepID=UPI003AAC3C37
MVELLLEWNVRQEMRSNVYDLAFRLCELLWVYVRHDVDPAVAVRAAQERVCEAGGSVGAQGHVFTIRPE